MSTVHTADQTECDSLPDSGVLWQWTRLRRLPAPQHRAVAATWARGVLASSDDWLFVDTETTGLCATDQVIEIAIAKAARDCGRWRLEPLMVQRIRPSVPISFSAIAVHGITEAHLRNSPTFPEVADRIRTVIGGRRLLAWNATFDRAAIRRTVDSWRTPAVAEDDSWHCAMRAHAVWAGQPGNRTLYRYHKLGGDHTAMGDVQCMLDRVVAMAELDD